MRQPCIILRYNDRGSSGQYTMMLPPGYNAHHVYAALDFLAEAHMNGDTEELSAFYFDIEEYDPSESMAGSWYAVYDKDGKLMHEMDDNGMEE